jgi:hypothetical protein
MDFNTGPGSGSSSPTPGNGPRPASGGTGGEFTLQDPVGSFVRTVVAVVTQPVPFFRGIARQGNFVNPLVFALICALISALLSGIIGLIFAPLFAGPGDTGEAFAGGIVGLVVTLILSPILTTIGLIIAAGIFHLLVLIFVRPSNMGFEATFRVASYTQVTQLISWIPIVGSIVAAVWSIVLLIFGIREVHSTTTGKAAAIVLIPVAVIFVLALIIVALVGAALFFGTQQGQF